MTAGPGGGPEAHAPSMSAAPSGSNLWAEITVDPSYVSMVL